MSSAQPFRSILTIAAALTVVVWATTLFAQTAAPAQTPTEAFTAYRKALAGAKDYDALLPFMDAKNRAMIEGMTTEMRAGMFELMKKFEATYSDVAVAGETPKGEAVVLSLTGKDPNGQPAKGSVTMTKEATGWKVSGAERWSSRPS